ncbi:MAG: ATP-binding cassette domain-containing protein [Lentisphaeria bacterium]|nr:ATP-binding cassette domain-containing protein [Lentisphaeria bacterium]
MIEVKNLVKRYGPKTAVDDVSFSVERGEVLGFLGPNGAGKSTTMRMITGFFPPSSGTAVIGGKDIIEADVEAKALIGYLPENAPAYSEMSVEKFLTFMAEIRGFKRAEARKLVEKAIVTCYLQSVRHQTVETLSKGYRHRACFAQAILHDPPVLILDEPTDGLDPNQKREMRDLIRRMGKHKAIILSTHILEEVDAVCTRVVIIDQGKLIFNGSPDELRGQSSAAGAVSITVSGPEKAVRDAFKKLPGVKRVDIADISDGRISLILTPDKGTGRSPDLAAAAARVAAENTWELSELSTNPGRLEDVFSQITVSDTAKKGGALS